MGFFSERLCSYPDSIEEQLRVVYGLFFQSLGLSEAKASKMIRQLIGKVKEEAAGEGTDQLPMNFGDILLDREESDPRIKAMLAAKRRQGVKDEDIRSWWNRHDYERRVMLKVEEVHQLALFVNLRQQGLSTDAAAEQTHRSQVRYSDASQDDLSLGDDRPLPFELLDRINRYIESRIRSDPGRYQEELVSCSSINAHIREQLRKGDLQ